MPTGRAYRGVVIAAISACLLAACTSSGGTPNTLPSTSSSRSSPAVSPSSLPPSTSGPDSSSPTPSSPSPASPKAAVEAAVKAYYAAVNVAISTGDTTELEKLTDKGCPCEKLISAVKSLFKNGSTKDAHWTVQAARVKSVTGRVANTEVAYRTGRYSELDGQGRVTHVYPAVETKSSVILTLEGSAWKVSNYFILSGHDVKS